MKKFIHDILRDKGSTKFSITKVLAFIFSLFFMGYLTFYLFYLKESVDHTLIIELIGFIGGLIGFKNNWGIRNSKNEKQEVLKYDEEDFELENKMNDFNDESEF